MTKRAITLTALALFLLALVPAVSLATAPPGPNGKVAFASGRGNSEVPAPAANDDAKAKIWVADFPSGTPVQATTLPANTQHRHPNWSPDHTRIVYAAGVAFSGTYALWIVDLRTTPPTETQFVAAAAMQDRPTWSPDGTRIAYGSEGDLWVKGVAVGSVAIQLTNTAGVVEERPVWSPDGETLYYNRGVAPNRDLYSKSPVTPGGTELPILTDATKDDWQPALSPDGKRLCFLRGPQSDAADLYTVNVNGTGVAPYATSASGDLNCVWSSDGKRILYTLGAFGAGQLVSRDINGNDFTAHNGMNVADHFDGNADLATNFSPKCDAKGAAIPVNGFTAVQLSCTDPDSGFGIAPPTPKPVGDNTLEIVKPPTNGTLGGINDDGQVIYTPNKDFKGTDTFTYTGDDQTSSAPPATVTIQVGQEAAGGDKTAPQITALKLSVKRWRVGGKLASISKSPIGTTISFKLSEAARATLSFERALPGRKAGKKCVKQTAANAERKPCTRYVAAGSLGFQARAAANKVKFQGRVSRTKTLVPGSYRVVVSARDAAGNLASKVGPTFTIVTN